MPTIARTPAQVVAGEMTSGTLQQRWADALGVASVMYNRSLLTGVPISDVVSVKSQFNAFNSPLPAGAAAYVDLAQQALDYVATNGPINGATYYSTPEAAKNLPSGLSLEGVTEGHQYYSDPAMRSIKTAVGTIKPDPSNLAAAPSSDPLQQALSGPYAANGLVNGITSVTPSPATAVTSQSMPAATVDPAFSANGLLSGDFPASSFAPQSQSLPTLNNFSDLASAGPISAPMNVTANGVLGTAPGLDASTTTGAIGPMSSTSLPGGAGDVSTSARAMPAASLADRMGIPSTSWADMAAAGPIQAQTQPDYGVLASLGPMQQPDLSAAANMPASASLFAPSVQTPALNNFADLAAAGPVQAPQAMGINSPQQQAMDAAVTAQLSRMSPLGVRPAVNNFADLAAAGPISAPMSVPATAQTMTTPGLMASASVPMSVTPADASTLAARFAPSIDPTTNTTSFLDAPVSQPAAKIAAIQNVPGSIPSGLLSGPSLPGQQAINGVLGNMPAYDTGLLSSPSTQSSPDFSPLSYAPINTQPTGYNRPYAANPAVTDKIQAAVTSVLGPGASVQVTSGQEGGLAQFGSNRHKTGLAADITITGPDGHVLSWNNPADLQAMEDIAQSAATQQANIGLGYSDPNMMHIDYVSPNNFTPGQDTSWGLIGNNPEFASKLADARVYGTMPASYYDAAAQNVVANNVVPTINNPFGYTQAQETGGLLSAINPVTATPVQKTDLAPTTATETSISNPMPSYSDEMARVAATQPTPSYDQSLSLPSAPTPTISATPMSLTGQIASVPQATGFLGTPVQSPANITVAGPVNTPAVTQQQTTLSGDFPAAPAKPTGLLGGLVNKGTIAGGILGSLAAGPVGGLLGGLIGNQINKQGGLTGLMGNSQQPSINNIGGGLMNVASVYGGAPAGTQANTNNGGMVTALGNGWTQYTNPYGVTESISPQGTHFADWSNVFGGNTPSTPGGAPTGGGSGGSLSSPGLF